MTYKVGQSETETGNDRDRRRDREWDEEKVEGGTEGKEEVYRHTEKIYTDTEIQRQIYCYRGTESDREGERDFCT